MVRSLMPSASLRAAGALLGTAALVALVPIGASAAATSAPASVANPVATSCYGGAVAVTLPANGYSKVFTTTSRCNDIDLRINSGGGQWVAVCWAAHNNCQSSWTWVPQDGAFHVVATTVLDGTTFYFDTTEGGGTRQGSVAA